MVKLQKKRTPFFLLRGALLKKGYKQKAHNIVLETIVILKSLILRKRKHRITLILL